MSQERIEHKVSAEEMVNYLVNRVAELEMELGAARIIISRLQGEVNGEVPQGQPQNGVKAKEKVGQS